MTDVWTLLEDTIYTSPDYSTEATLTPVGGSAVTLTVLDRTEGERVPVGGGDVDTIVPAALLRVAELTEAGLTRQNLGKAAITFNGRTWRVESTRPRTAPTGETQYLLTLTES